MSTNTNDRTPTDDQMEDARIEAMEHREAGARRYRRRRTPEDGPEPKPIVITDADRIDAIEDRQMGVTYELLDDYGSERKLPWCAHVGMSPLGSGFPMYLYGATWRDAVDAGMAWWGRDDTRRNKLAARGKA